MMYDLCMFVLLVAVHPEAGRLMARYCVAFDTMKQFNSVEGHETLSDMVGTSTGRHGSCNDHNIMNECLR